MNILSGLVAGNFSAFWEGLTIMILMFIAYMVSKNAAIIALMPPEFIFAAPVFAFGLVAFGFLGMGPVTIAVDSFGPVSDNAQSIYELSLIESRPDVKEIVKKEYGVEPNFESAKHFLESADGAGNTFKATAKPVLIGTAVVGATTMVFGIIILLEGLFGNVSRQAFSGSAGNYSRLDHGRLRHLLVHRRFYPGSYHRRLSGSCVY